MRALDSARRRCAAAIDNLIQQQQDRLAVCACACARALIESVDTTQTTRARACINALNHADVVVGVRIDDR